MNDDTDGTQADTAGLGRVRDELTRLGHDESSAPPVPPEVTSRVVDSLRRAGRRRSRNRMAAAVGAVAGVVAAGLGTAMLLRTPQHTPVATPTAERITTSVTPVGIPLSEEQIAALLSERADLGPLSDPQRLSACLTGLGYPTSAQVLGARPVEVAGEPGVLLVLPGTTPDLISALVVRPNCSSIDTGLVADTEIRRP